MNGVKAARLRLLISPSSQVRVEVYPLDQIGWGKEVLKIKIAEEQTNSFLRGVRDVGMAIQNRDWRKKLRQNYQSPVPR